MYTILSSFQMDEAYFLAAAKYIEMNFVRANLIPRKGDKQVWCPRFSHIACRPNFENKSKDEVEFVVYYDRFHFDGKEWVKYQRVEKDFWEAEDLLPLSKFPAGP